MSDKLAIIGASYLQVPLIERANNMGYETHVFSWSAGEPGEIIASQFHPISIVEKENILDECRKLNIAGVCTIASDLAALTVGYIADRLKLPGNPWNSVLVTTNKHAMREAFRLHNDPSPHSYLVDEATAIGLLDIRYPAIVKPTDRSGSRGVTKVFEANQVADAIASAVSQSFEHKAVLEEYVEGEEFSIECLSFKGQHEILAVTKKYTTGSPHFIELGHEEPAILPRNITMTSICAITAHALDGLGIKNGASHAEAKIDKDGVLKFIEIGARMGGDCIGSHLVELSTGIDYTGNVIRIAVGETPEMVPMHKPRAAAVRYIINKSDRELITRAKTDSNVSLEYSIMHHNLENSRVTDSSNRPGCFVVSSSKRDFLLPYIDFRDIQQQPSSQ